MLNLPVTKEELRQLHSCIRFVQTSLTNTGRPDVDQAFGSGYYDKQLTSLLALEEKLVTAVLFKRQIRI